MITPTAYLYKSPHGDRELLHSNTSAYAEALIKGGWRETPLYALLPPLPQLGSDLRQGLTPTQHAVLDKIEESATGWVGSTIAEKCNRAEMLARRITLVGIDRAMEAKAIEAAALLIDAADDFSRMRAGERP